MAVNLPYLKGVASAYDKFIHDVETDAKNFIEKDLAAANEHRGAVFASAKQRVADVRQNVAGVSKMLDDIEASMASSNGGPTSGDSPSPSPVSAQPSEAAQLPEAK